MFAKRFFPQRFFPTRYYPGVGANFNPTSPIVTINSILDSLTIRSSIKEDIKIMNFIN